MSRNITDLHPRLQAKVTELKEKCSAQGIEIGISECLRTAAEQDAIYAKGRTEPGVIVTNCQGSSYKSMHQWGVAFDFYIKMDVDGDGEIADDAFNNTTGLFEKVGEIGQSIGLEWGGNWKGIIDRPHFQLPDWGSTSKQLINMYGTPDKFFATWENRSTAQATLVENNPTIYSHKYLIGLLQTALNIDLNAGLVVDKKQGPKTFAACPTLNASIRNKYPNVVEAYQLLLIAAGYSVGSAGADGDFYTGTAKGTKEYQRNVVGMKYPDGEATKKKKTWSHLLRLS